MKIKFIGHSYHQSTQSSKFFIQLLQELGSIDYAWDTSWLPDGKECDLQDLDSYDLILVWQLPQIARKIPEHLREKCVYAPMHDAVHGINAKFWRRLRGMRILCFSVHDYVTAIRNHLEAFYWHYYPAEPAPYQAASFEHLRLFFWQRRPYPNWRALCGKIPMTQFKSIHLHEAPDPTLGKFLKPIQSEIDVYGITTSSWFEKQDDYIRKLSENNVFVAPREREGIGMAMLEAQGAGMICIANDAPTMNEYIVDGVNGFLLKHGQDQQVIEITDGAGMSRHARHYYAKGSKNSIKRTADVLAYLKKPSEPAYHKVLSPLKLGMQKWIPRNTVNLADLQAMAQCFSAYKDQSTRPIVSIVTVTKDDAPGLAKTLASVFSQTYRHVEFIVVDGKSADKTPQLLKACAAGIDRMVSERDQGPYDAMNKAVALCKGKYVIFMNAGDEFFDQHALDFAMQDAPEDADIICGHHMYIRAPHKWSVISAADVKRTYTRLVQGQLDNEWLVGIPCHQATLTSVKLLKARPYDWQRFQVAADHDFLFDAVANGAIAYNSNVFIAKYYSGGFSSQTVQLCNANWKEIALKHCTDHAAVDKFYGNC